MNVAGKVALVTGGARRIGRALVAALHGAGMEVVIHCRASRAEADALAAELNARRPASACVLAADLNDLASLRALARDAVAWRGRLDALVNNASNFYPTALDALREEDWDALLGVNLKAPLFLSAALAPELRARRGAVVNIIDIHAERPLAGYPVYSVAKAGLAMLTRALARELAPAARCNGVSPGAVLWPEDDGNSERRRQEIIARTALKRQGSPADVAAAALFLIRDAEYVTGQILAVDGGRTVTQ